MPNKPYELIEHTADVGIRIRGRDPKDLFQNAAIGMFDIIAKDKTPALRRKPGQKITIKQSADDLGELFINWLNELLSLSAAKELIFSGFRIDKFDPKNIEATVNAYPMKDYELNTEIKAATYHGLKLEQDKGGWQAEVIFDV